MLFVPNEERLSNDLLYNSPNYPILNITNNEKVLDLEGDNIVLRDAYNLEPILEYFDYNKELTYEDIIRIRHTFFTGRFAKDHCELFGYKETMAEDLTFYENLGKIVTDPKELEKRRRKFRAQQKAGHKLFTKISKHELPREYFNILDEKGDDPIIKGIKTHEKKMYLNQQKKKVMLKH